MDESRSFDGVEQPSFEADIDQFCSMFGTHAADAANVDPPEARFTSSELRRTTSLLMSLRLRQLATSMAETVDTISRPKIRCETSTVLGVHLTQRFGPMVGEL